MKVNKKLILFILKELGIKKILFNQIDDKLKTEKTYKRFLKKGFDLALWFSYDRNIKLTKNVLTAIYFLYSLKHLKSKARQK
jgi:hypothetical protein